MLNKRSLIINLNIFSPIDASRIPQLKAKLVDMSKGCLSEFILSFANLPPILLNALHLLKNMSIVISR